MTHLISNKTVLAAYARRALALLLGVLTLAVMQTPASAMGLAYTAYRTDAGTPALIREGDFVRKGEKLLISINYKNADAVSAKPGAIVFSLPTGCRFVSGETAEPLAVSVDGGHSFGPLAQLTVLDGGVRRAATAQDITHLRLTLDHAVAPGQGGEIRIIAAMR